MQKTDTSNASLNSHLEKLYFEREAMIDILTRNNVPDWKNKVAEYLNSVDQNSKDHQNALSLLRDEVAHNQ